MIPRYSLPEISAIWKCNNRFKIFTEIEKLTAEALAKHEFIPNHVSEIIDIYGEFDEDGINELEKELRHDVIAYLTNLTGHIVKNAERDGYKKFSSEQIQDAVRYIHYSLTSSDILDTAFCVQLSQSSNLLLSKLNYVCGKLKELAQKYKYQVCIGRTHGVHAEPISFGQKLLLFYSEFKRAIVKMQSAKEEISRCMISGPVGNFSTNTPLIEEYVAKKLGLKPEVSSSQVIPRDRYAFLFSVIGLIGSSIEHIAVEIRHLQRTEVLEASEGFGAKQKGSSAMPHKKNPVLSENLTGLARMLRSYVLPAMENVALWHERDISHSSVERIIGPDACILLDFALARLYELLNNLVIHPENMKRNLEILGDMHYSHVVLLSLTRLGVGRDDAYKIVQRCSMKNWDDKTNSGFIRALESDDELILIIKNCNKDVSQFFEEIKKHDYLKYVDEVYEKIFKEYF